jgi:hypothetical protein
LTGKIFFLVPQVVERKTPYLMDVAGEFLLYDEFIAVYV